MSIPSGLTTEQLLWHLGELAKEREIRYTQRFDSQEKAVMSALSAAEKAVAKAEGAAEKRFESINEFRGTLSDQAANLMPRSESRLGMDAVSGKIDDLASRIDALAIRVERGEGKGVGLSAAWGYLIGAVGLIGAVIALMTR